MPDQPVKARGIAVILAGGTGSRVGSATPKQLVDLAGMPVMEHSVAVFQASGAIDEIHIVMHPDHIAEAEKIAGRYPKVTKTLAGGATRNDSTKAALDELRTAQRPDAKVLFHDAARPLVTQRTIDDVLAALDAHAAVSVGVPSADTIFELNDHGEIARVPARRSLRRAQTPQGFRLETIQRAYDLAWRDAAFTEATDDCSVVFRYLPKVPIAVVMGSDNNLKITEPADIFLAEKLLQGSSVELHRLGEGGDGLAV